MTTKIVMFDIRIDPLTRKEAVVAIFSLFQSETHDAHMVVTPNVDHIVMLNANANFRTAYSASSLVLVDGNPVMWASKLLGKPVPETVPGSDLFVLLLQESKRGAGFSIFLLGAPPGVAKKAGMMIQEGYPNVRVVGTNCPPLGFEKDQDELKKIVQQINEAQPDLLLVGLGAPKQELWAHAYKQQLKVKVILCAGATIEFVAKEKQRAPKWVQRLSMEWFYRMMLEPKRLFYRYAKDAIIFPFLLAREFFKK